MGIESPFTGKYISDLVATNPVGGSDPKSEGDDHIRGIKLVLQNTFSAVTGEVTASHTELNYNDITTLGTVEANKVWTADSSGNTDGDAGTLSNVLIDVDSAPVRTMCTSVANSGLLTTQTRYMGIQSFGSSLQSTEYNCQSIMAHDCVISNLYVQAQANSATTGTFDVTVRIDGVSSSLTVSITAGSTAVFSDTTHTEAVTAGQAISIMLVGNGTDGNFSYPRVSMLLREA